MAKKIEELMDELRQDLARWKRDIESIKEQSPSSELPEKIEAWIAEAERVLARWGKGEP
jgi:hypothetical protein